MCYLKCDKLLIKTNKFSICNKTIKATRIPEISLVFLAIRHKQNECTVKPIYFLLYKNAFHEQHTKSWTFTKKPVKHPAGIHNERRTKSTGKCTQSTSAAFFPLNKYYTQHLWLRVSSPALHRGFKICCQKFASVFLFDCSVLSTITCIGEI